MEARARVATEDDLEAIAETLARAFEHEVAWSWPFERDGGPVDRVDKLAALRAILGFFAASALGNGWVRVSEGVEAVAVWIPPGSPAMPPSQAERFPALVREVCDAATAERVLTLMDAFDRHHPGDPPHYQLGVLGTHPDHAGQGLGMALLAANLEEVDAAGAPAYLDAPDPRNARRYERVGFRPLRKVDLVPGVLATLMWREPGGAGATRS